MMQTVRHLLKRQRMLLAADDGVIMTEAILAVPLITFMAIAILEMGSIFWQREQIITGLRDAVRYAARCHPDEDEPYTIAECDATARNIAYFGNVDGSGNPRVPGWKAPESPITFTRSDKSTQKVIIATTTHTLSHSSLFGLLSIADIKLTLGHEQRVIGW